MSAVSKVDVKAVLAGVAVQDLARSERWYTQVIGREPDAHPMPILADWYLGAAGTLQVTVDAVRAGGSTVTVVVEDIAATVQRLARHRIALEVDSVTSDKVHFGMLLDPDGNSVTVLQAKEGFNPQGR